MTVEWHGPERKREIDQAVMDGLDAASGHLLNTIEKNISTMGPPSSAPYQFPHIRSGDLRVSMNRWPLKRTGQVGFRVGSTLDYAKWLEDGTRFMRRRPWLSKALKIASPAMRALLRGVRTRRGSKRGL